MDFAQGVSNPCPGMLTGSAPQTFVALINTLMASQCLLAPDGKYPADYGSELKDGDEFDFIVVGAGSAGSVVASRLSENPNWKILLLEAGGYPPLVTEIPNIFFSFVYSSFEWGYDMEPSATSCLGLKNKVCGCPRGKVLGGTSTINGMGYIRGNRKDFDTWAEKGNTGWDYDSILKYYSRFEDLQEADDDTFEKGGELKISHYVSKQPIRNALLEAYRELGYGEYTEEKPIGYLDAYTTISKGTRYSAAKAFLTKAKNRDNLYLALNAQVGKLLFNKNSLSVAGVEVRINGKILKIKSTKEVILSAGALNSPQILMNSGIGPKQHLEDLGIQVRKNLKVGENLKDHVFFSGLFMNIAEESLTAQTPEGVMDDWYQYFMHRKGTFSRSGMENLLLFADPKHKSKYPTLELYYVPVYKNDLYGAFPILHSALNMPEEVMRTQIENNKKSHNIIFLPSTTYTKSVGKLLLRSSDPFDTPKIFSNYFSDEADEDLVTLLDGIRFYQNVTKTKAFSRYKPELVHLDIPNCRKFIPDSDDYWKCALKNLATTVYHQMGTCKMGTKSDPDAVVDPRLRVHGVNGVRVIDGSIIPTVISCNTNAPIMMIGEKGAEMVKEDWTNRHTDL